MNGNMGTGGWRHGNRWRDEKEWMSGDKKNYGCLGGWKEGWMSGWVKTWEGWMEDG